MSVAKLSMVMALVLAVPGAVHAQSIQENPHQNRVDDLSAVTVISGWKCDPGAITFSVDDGDPIDMASGTDRGDTSATCGNDGKNGYGVLWNVNLFGDGEHTAEFFDDGVKFAEATFNVVRFGENFLRDVIRELPLPNFPMPGEYAMLEWREGLQNFVVTEFSPTPLMFPDLIPKKERFFTGTNFDYCQGPYPSGPGLLVVVRNQGDGTAGTSTLNVDFGAFGDQDVAIPSLAPGAEYDAVVDFPVGCFNPDCDFAISVDADDDVTESNEDNNDVDPVICIG